MDIYLIYKNVQEFIECRKYTHEEYLNKDEFYKEIRSNGFILIKCKNIGAHINVVLTDLDSEIPGKKQNFIKMKTKIPSGEIILISSKILTTSNKRYAIEQGIKIKSYTFNKFVINMTKAPLVPPHRILSTEEEKKVLTEVHKNKIHFPSILQDDTQAIWLGAKPGDIIEITRFVESTGESKFYRHCVSA